MEKELCKMPCIKYFENDNFILKYDENENIILNSIKVAKLNEDNTLNKFIAFDISVRLDGCIIKPCLTYGKFIIMYERYVYANKVIIKSDQIPYCNMNSNGDVEVVIE